MRVSNQNGFLKLRSSLLPPYLLFGGLPRERGTKFLCVFVNLHFLKIFCASKKWVVGVTWVSEIFLPYLLHAHFTSSRTN